MGALCTDDVTRLSHGEQTCAVKVLRLSTQYQELPGTELARWARTHSTQYMGYRGVLGCMGTVIYSEQLCT